MRQDILLWLLSFGGLEMWAALLFWEAWQEHGCCLRRQDFVAALHCMPSEHALAYFTRPLALRRQDADRLLWRQPWWLLPCGGWHGSLQRQAGRLQLTRRLGWGPILVWPLLVFLPYGVFILPGLYLATWYAARHADRQLFALVEFLRHPLLAD